MNSGAQLLAVRATLAVLDEDGEAWERLFSGLLEPGKDAVLIAFPAVLAVTAMAGCSTLADVAFRLRQLEAELSEQCAPIEDHQ